MATAIVFVLVIGTLIPLIAAFCPGAAMLHLAKRTGWSIGPTATAVILLLVPITVMVISPDAPLKALVNADSEIVYAFWFYPGLIVLLNKYSDKGPKLGTIASLIYLSPYLLTQIILLLLDGIISGQEISGLIAILVILTFRSQRLLVPARIVGVALLLVPIAVPLAV